MDPFGEFPNVGSQSGIFTAADLQGMEFPPINWVVPGVLPEGLSILAGKPKLGKSWLALDIALAVAGGGSVLGRECDPGPVLYLALEDNQRRLQRRLNHIEPHLSWPADLELNTRWPRLDQGGLKAIEQWLKTRDGAKLVIVDTLAVVRPAGKASDSIHTSDYAALRGLHQIASNTNVAIMIIHHLRKADADDPFDTVSGSTGLTGAADTTLILTRREGDGGCILYGRGRDLEEFETGLEFVPRTCRWRDLGDPVEAFAGDTRQTIFAAIKAGKTAAKDIIAETGINADNIYQTLRRMVRSGDLKNDGRGTYSRPSDPLPPCQESQVVRTDSEVFENKGVSKASESDSRPQGCQVVRNNARQSDNLTLLTPPLRRMTPRSQTQTLGHEHHHHHHETRQHGANLKESTMTTKTTKKTTASRRAEIAARMHVAKMGDGFHIIEIPAADGSPFEAWPGPFTTKLAAELFRDDLIDICAEGLNEPIHFEPDNFVAFEQIARVLEFLEKRENTANLRALARDLVNSQPWQHGHHGPPGERDVEIPF